MQTLADQIKKRIVFKKPNATTTTVKTYYSLINHLLKTKDDSAKLVDWEWIDNQPESVIEFVSEFYKERPLATIKTLFAALYAITENKVYHAHMMKLSAEYAKEQMKQKKSEKQQNNWISFQDVERYVQSAYNAARPYLSSKTPLEGLPLQIVQEYIILALTTGVFIAPRRSQDWTEMKLRGVSTRSKDPKEYNYIKGNSFHFVKYKTASVYGEQVIEIPKQLKNLLNKWKKLNQHDFLLVNADGSQMSVVRIAQILNRIFGKNISTGMLRHIYITDKLGHIPSLEDMQNMAEDLGHSVPMMLEYIKH